MCVNIYICIYVLPAQELTSLGKPKRPRTGFNIFMAEHFEEARGSTMQVNIHSILSERYIVDFGLPLCPILHAVWPVVCLRYLSVSVSITHMQMSFASSNDYSSD